MPSRIMICEGSFTSTRDDKPLVVENENGRYVAFSPTNKGINASLRSLFQSIHKRHLSSIEYVSHALSGIFVLKKASHWMTVARWMKPIQMQAPNFLHRFPHLKTKPTAP